MSEFAVTLLTKSDGPAVAKHLSKAFCLDEPILNHLGVGVDPSFLKMCVELIDQGISLKAINANGEIAGVFLSELKEKSHHNHEDYFQPKATKEISAEIQTVNGILRFMDESANIFGYNPDVETYVDGAILSVDSNYRSFGIGSKLFEALIALCRDRNVPILKVFCSSTFTARICEKFGLTKTFDIPYRDIKLDNLPTADIPEPHSIARVYCLDFRTN